MIGAVVQRDFQVDYREFRDRPFGEAIAEAFLDRRDVLFRNPTADDVFFKEEGFVGLYLGVCR